MNRVQLTTDGHRAYLDAVDQAFDRAIDYAMLVKRLWQRARRREAIQPCGLPWNGIARSFAGVPIQMISTNLCRSVRISRTRMTCA